MAKKHAALQSLASLAVVAALGALSVVGAARADDAARGPAAGRCIGSFSPPAALAIARDAPLAFGHAYIVQGFSPGVTGSDRALTTFCHPDGDVVGAAVDAASAAYYVATPRTVDRVRLLNDGSAFVADSIEPPLGPHDRVEAVATNADGQIEVVISTAGDPSAPRFLLYDRLAAGHARPLRDFTSTLVASAVSAVAFDARGESYAYDDAGEIVEFASNATGTDPAPLRTIAGPATLLRPAPAWPHGKRPLAIDRDGNITAADDRFVMTFATDANGDATPLDTLVSSDTVYGLATDSRGFLYVLRGDLHGDDPTTSVKIFEAVSERVKSASDASPLKQDVVGS